MELRVLRYFLMVAQEGDITKAARLFHVTQPTVSRQLMQLEEELGVALFHRDNYHVTLTEEGALLKRRAQELLELADKTRREFALWEELRGEIAIGCGETRNMDCLAGLIAAFQKEHPLVQYRIYSAAADDVQGRMEAGLSPVQVKEVVYQAFDYLGMGRAWPFSEITNGVLARRRTALLLPPQAVSTMENRLEMGAAVQAEIFTGLGEVAAKNAGKEARDMF